MTYDPTDPRLTAYALDELSAEERKAFEEELQRHPHAQRDLDDIAALAELLTQELQQEPGPTLTDAQRQAIEEAMTHDEHDPTQDRVAPEQAEPHDTHVVDLHTKGHARHDKDPSSPDSSETKGTSAADSPPSPDAQGPTTGSATRWAPLGLLAAAALAGLVMVPAALNTQREPADQSTPKPADGRFTHDEAVDDTPQRHAVVKQPVGVVSGVNGTPSESHNRPTGGIKTPPSPMPGPSNDGDRATGKRINLPETVTDISAYRQQGHHAGRMPDKRSPHSTSTRQTAKERAVFDIPSGHERGDNVTVEGDKRLLSLGYVGLEPNAPTTPMNARRRGKPKAKSKPEPGQKGP
ncbi:MAG: hypothetical protein AAFX99_19770, partial [Myxococcota bacterium]